MIARIDREKLRSSGLDVDGFIVEGIEFSEMGGEEDTLKILMACRKAFEAVENTELYRNILLNYLLATISGRPLPKALVRVMVEKIPGVYITSSGEELLIVSPSDEEVRTVLEKGVARSPTIERAIRKTAEFDLSSNKVRLDYDVFLTPSDFARLSVNLLGDWTPMKKILEEISSRISSRVKVTEKIIEETKMRLVIDKSDMENAILREIPSGTSENDKNRILSLARPAVLYVSIDMQKPMRAQLSLSMDTEIASFKTVDNQVEIEYGVGDRVDEAFNRLMRQLGGFVSRYGLVIKDAIELASTLGFQQSEDVRADATYKKMEKEINMGSTTVNAQVTVNIGRSWEIASSGSASSVITIRGSQIPLRVLDAVKESVETLKTKYSIAELEKTEDRLVVVIEDKPEKAPEIVRDTADLVGRIQLDYEVATQPQSRLGEEEIIGLYIIKGCLPFNTSKEVGIDEVVLGNKVAEILEKKFLHSIAPAINETILDAVLLKPKVVAKAIIPSVLGVDKSGKLTIMGKPLNDIISTLAPKSYSASVFVQQAAPKILELYKEATGKSMIKTLIERGGVSLEMAKTLVKIGDTPEVEVLEKKIEGTRLWDALSDDEKKALLRNLPLRDFARALESLIDPKAKVKEIVSAVCSGGTPSLCTYYIAKHNYQLVSKTPLRTVEIDSDIWIDAGGFAIQIDRLGLTDEYLVMNKTDRKIYRIKAKSLTNAVIEADKIATKTVKKPAETVTT